jgi:1-acyl-sn-glycerol-3-phosphate acyltransferase
MAHNAGMFWGRNAFTKRPGTIRVVIGKPIASTDISPELLNEKVKFWIENEMLALRPGP